MIQKRMLIGASLFMFCPAVQAAETQSYTYDPFGRLVSVVHAGTTNDNIRSTYAYDAAGNRINVEVNTPVPGGNGKKVVVNPVGATFAVIAVP